MSALHGLEVANLAAVPSPALLVWPARVQANIDRMIALVGGDCDRLRPHVKTHKMEAVVRLQLEAGIEKFKCATIAEVELCLLSGVQDVLLAYPPVGPNQSRLVRLATMFPEAQLHFLADESTVPAALDALCREAGVTLGVFIDFDCGMARTGTASAPAAVALAHQVRGSGHLRLSGIHAYDGHVRATPVAEREALWSTAMERVAALEGAMADEGIAVEAVVGGGSPTFGFHSAQRGWQCSPGTTLFWDNGYGSMFPELPFEPAAAVLTRVVSKPGSNRLCLDLGHKAVASEGPLEKRVRLLGLEQAVPVQHSEEHLVVESEEVDRVRVGDAFLGIPHHICPTVALYGEAALIRDGQATGETWPVTARNRKITV